MGILPNHGVGDFLAQPRRRVVVDEAHVYRGVFGSHVANVLRRLRGSPPPTDAAALPPRVGDRRQPGRAGRAADGARGRAARRRNSSPLPSATLSASVEPAGRRRGAPDPRQRARRGGGDRRASCARRRADDLLRQVAQRGGADRQPRRGDRATRLADLVAPYRAGYTPRSAATSRRGWSAAGHARSWPPMRWSSASTSARSTPPSSSRSRGPSPRSPDVGPRRAPEAVTGRLHRRRRRAGPVLLPPPRRVPRPPRGVGDRLVRERAHSPRPPAVRGSRGSARPGGRRGDLGPRWQAHADPLGVDGGAGRRRGRYVLRCAEDYPAARVSLRSAAPDASRWSTSPTAVCSARSSPDARRSTAHDGAVYLHLGRILRGP